MTHSDLSWPRNILQRGIRRVAGVARSRLAPVWKDRAIVMYHGIDRRCDTRFNQRFFSEDALLTQIRWLKQEFTIVSLSDVFTRRHDGGRRFLAITFDDGERNNLLYALPIIEEEDVPATFFVTSIRTTGRNILWFDAVDVLSYYHPGSFEHRRLVFRKSTGGRLVNDELGIDLNAYVMNLPHEAKYELIDQLQKGSDVDLERDRSIEDYWTLLDDRDLSQLASSHLVEIGSHAHTHTNLDLLPEAEVRYELEHSKEYLERSSGREVVSLAYPNGTYTRRMIDLAESLGYKFQLAVNYHFQEDTEDARIHDRLGLYPDRPTSAIFDQVGDFFRLR